MKSVRAKGFITKTPLLCAILHLLRGTWFRSMWEVSTGKNRKIFALLFPSTQVISEIFLKKKIQRWKVGFQSKLRKYVKNKKTFSPSPFGFFCACYSLAI